MSTCLICRNIGAGGVIGHNIGKIHVVRRLKTLGSKSDERKTFRRDILIAWLGNGNSGLGWHRVRRFFLFSLLSKTKNAQFSLNLVVRNIAAIESLTVLSSLKKYHRFAGKAFPEDSEYWTIVCDSLVWIICGVGVASRYRSKIGSALRLRNMAVGSRWFAKTFGVWTRSSSY